MKSSVIVFPGSNCDRDIADALVKMQFKNQMVWHKETNLPKSDLIVIPGGFSYMFWPAPQISPETVRKHIKKNLAGDP